MAQPPVQYIQPQDYLVMEREATDRHEYYKGEVFAMSGASYNHNVIEDNIRLLIGSHLKKFYRLQQLITTAAANGICTGKLKV